MTYAPDRWQNPGDRTRKIGKMPDQGETTSAENTPEVNFQ
jgi:hypothetical protein